MTRLILIRHAETEANVNEIWHGSLDAPLTPLGQAQVRATVQRLIEIHAVSPIDHIYVSPLLRARQTAQAIADVIERTLRIEEGLSEMSIGDWEGRTFEHLREIDRLWERWQADPAFAPPNGESPVLFGRRVLAIYEQLADTHPHETLLTITHGCAISSLLAQWLGEGPLDWQRWDPANCAISILERVEQTWHPVLINDTSHLEGISESTDDGLSRVE